MERAFEVLKEYCKAYNTGWESERTIRLRKIFWVVRSTAPEPAFREQNIVALATRLTKKLDYRQENGKEFLYKRQLAAA